jgi:hypothetical protein
MGRPLLIALAAVLAFVLVFTAGGALLADSWRVETVRVIGAPPDRVLHELADLGTWQAWCTVDATLGPHTARSVTGERGKAGSALRWKGSQGEAALILTDVGPSAIGYEFTVSDRGLLGRGGCRLEPVAEGTRVTWHDVGGLPGLPARWAGWFGAVQEAVRNQQEASLGNLARRLEDERPR